MGKSVSIPCKVSKTSSAKAMYAVGASMVSSNSGLSWLDHPVNRENRNVVVKLLEDLRMSITAVWLVSRPIDRNVGDSFEHWCVKIQARGCLISIDFLESSGKGAFGLQQRTDVDAELAEFMYYGVKNRETKQITRHKWEILSSVTPHPLRNNTYFNYLSDHDKLKLEEFVKNAKIAPTDPYKFMKDIKCNKRVCDIAEFCSVFTADNKGYNPLTKNCQQFAAELFAYLVGDNYKEECERIFEHYQSPYDKKKWKNTQTQTETQNQTRTQTQTQTQKHSKSKPKPQIIINKRQKQRKLIKNSRQRRSMQSEEFFSESSPNSSDA